MKKTRGKAFLFIAILAVLVIASAGLAADGKRMMRSEKIILTPDELTWKEGPPALPQVKIAILDGDPDKRGFFVMRIKLPAGTKIPPHVHAKYRAGYNHLRGIQSCYGRQAGKSKGSAHRQLFLPSARNIA